MVIRKLAAIDIGSNALRLLINNVIEQKDRPPVFKKSEIIRVPVRLGEDAFVRGTISEKNTERLIKSIKAFDLLMEVYGVERYMACATSALRESRNGAQVAERVKAETGVDIEIINGQEEAKIIASTDLRDLIREDRFYLYVDVGGGSTEFTLFDQGKIVGSRSFKIGTVRLLNNLVDPSLWEEVKAWIQANVPADGRVELIGTGGNINKLHKMSGRKLGRPLPYVWLNRQYHIMSGMEYSQRILELGLNQDRADVIIPAARIFLNATKWSKAKDIHVPKIGLVDGMIKTLYYRK